MLLAGCARPVLLPSTEALYRLRSAIGVDTVARTVTLPLQHGFVDRRGVWYVVTESSDSADYFSALERVIALDPARHTVTIRLTRGYGLGKTVWYFSTEASDPVVATLEGATWAPLLAEAPGLADASSATGKPNPVLGGLSGVGVAVNCPVMAIFDRPNQ